MGYSRFLIGLSCVFLVAPTVMAAPVCTSGELFAGAPDYSDPADRAKDGQNLLDVPPLGFRALLLAGDKLVTAVGPELWYSDLAAQTPKLTRFAGREDRNARQSKPGPCREARFGNISGVALLPDGSITGADQMANDIFVVKDPFGPACAVSFIAGATEPQPELNPGYPAHEGDTDGAGASAMLRGPDWLAAFDDGVVYFLDTDNGKLKEVLADTAHTVKTVTKLPGASYQAMTALNGKLYLIGNNDSGEGLLIEIDPASGATRDVLRGRSDTWLSDGSINVSGLATDGAGLITSSSGQILYVTLKGDVEKIAGNGTYFELEQDYDPRQPHPAAELQLWSTGRTSTAGANVFLAYRDGRLYFSAAGATPYVERIACH
jgi:hypothetical protein